MVDEQRDRFSEAEWTEIDGILRTGSAIPTPIDEIPEGTIVLDSLTLRDVKKNGPKKGKTKARVVVHGAQMQEGTHYDQSHSPTMQIASMRSLIAVGAARNAKMAGGDFPQAYLNADQPLVYMWPPKSAQQYDDQGRRLVWAIPKALYGGKASGRYWYQHLRAQLVEYGFKVSEWDPCVFTRMRADGTFYYIGIYVDDSIHVYSSDEEHEELKRLFKADFHGYSDLGELSEVFNAEVTHTPKHVTLSQTRYIEDLAKQFGIDGIAHTPADDDLLKIVTDAMDTKEKVDDKLREEYRSIVGALLYVAMVSRPDVSLAVGMLSRALERPDAGCLNVSSTPHVAIPSHHQGTWLALDERCVRQTQRYV